MPRRLELSRIVLLLKKNSLIDEEVQQIHDILSPVAFAYIARKFPNIQESDRKSIANDAVYRLVESRRTIRDFIKVEAIFYRICRNLAINYFRDEKKSGRRFFIPKGETGSGGINNHDLPYTYSGSSRESGGDDIDSIGDDSHAIVKQTTHRFPHPNDLVLRQLLADAMKELRELKGERFYYVFHAKAEGASSKEIAEELCITANNVDVIYKRARDFLAGVIRRSGGF